MSAAIIAGVVQGVTELVKLGLLQAAQRHEAEAVLVRAMRQTPSAEEVERYQDAMGTLRDTDPAPAAPRVLADEDEYP